MGQMHGAMMRVAMAKYHLYFRSGSLNEKEARSLSRIIPERKVAMSPPKHPPMVEIMMEALTCLFGETLLRKYPMYVFSVATFKEPMTRNAGAMKRNMAFDGQNIQYMQRAIP